MKRRAVVLVGLAAALTAAYTSSAIGGAKQAERSASVGMSEFRFTMPSSLSAGRTTFTFRNTGRFPHNFTIVYTSQNGTRFRTPDVAGGKSRRQTVNLRPGPYVAVCTVFNGFHVSRGMTRRFTVGTFDQQQAAGSDAVTGTAGAPALAARPATVRRPSRRSRCPAGPADCGTRARADSSPGRRPGSRRQHSSSASRSPRRCRPCVRASARSSAKPAPPPDESRASRPRGLALPKRRAKAGVS